MNRWHVYEFLKSMNGRLDSKDARSYFPNMSDDEYWEGIMEYNIVARREGRYKQVKIV